MRTVVSALTALAVIGGAVIIPAVPASATESDNVNVTFDAEEYETYIDTQERRGIFDSESAEVEAEKELFIQEAAEEEIYYAADELVATPLPEGAFLVLPETSTITSVSFNLSDEEISASVETVDEGLLSSTGMGMDEFKDRGNDYYTINVPGKARLRAHWQKQKMLNDGDSKYDYWSYSRWATATPVAINNAPDWKIKRIKLRGWPLVAEKDKFKNTLKATPASATDDNCKQFPITLTLSGEFRGITAGADFSFQSCSSTKPTAGEKPGDYSVEFKQGVSVRGGQQATGYTEVVKVPQKFVPRWNDSQEFTIVRALSTIDCGKTNADRTCEK